MNLLDLLFHVVANINPRLEIVYTYHMGVEWCGPTLAMAIVNRAFLFTKDMLDCTNLFAFIDIFEPNNTSCCILTKYACKT